MGYAEKLNPNSEWNRKRAMNITPKIASPIISNQTKALTPAKQDEPMVIQITPKSLFWLIKGFLWQTFGLNPRQQSPAQTS